MSPTIENLLLRIVRSALHITAQGTWHAHVALAAHVNSIDVRVLPADTDYQDVSDRRTALNQTIYYKSRHEDEAQTGALLLALLADLEPFLAPEVAEVSA